MGNQQDHWMVLMRKSLSLDGTHMQIAFTRWRSYANRVCDIFAFFMRDNTLMLQ